MADENMNRRTTKMAAKELAGKMKGKGEIWKFMAGEVRAYVPGYN